MLLHEPVTACYTTSILLPNRFTYFAVFHLATIPLFHGFGLRSSFHRLPSNSFTFLNAFARATKASKHYINAISDRNFKAIALKHISLPLTKTIRLDCHLSIFISLKSAKLVKWQKAEV